MSQDDNAAEIQASITMFGGAEMLNERQNSATKVTGQEKLDSQSHLRVVKIEDIITKKAPCVTPKNMTKEDTIEQRPKGEMTVIRTYSLAPDIASAIKRAARSDGVSASLFVSRLARENEQVKRELSEIVYEP